MTTIITINGASRAGKDEITKLLKDDYGFRHIHPLSNLYTFLEEHFELPKGSIMQGEGKKFIAPGGSKELGEALVDFYHFVLSNNIGQWTKPHVNRALAWNLKRGQSLVFSGLRNHHEADLILKYRSEFPNVRLASYWVSRPGFEGYSSDDKQWEIYNKLASHASTRGIVRNDDSLAAFLTKIHKLIRVNNLDERESTEAKSN